MSLLFLVFWVTSILLFIVAILIYVPTKSVQGFPFLYILTSISYFCVFIIKAILGMGKWFLTVILSCISLIISDEQFLKIYLLVICMSSFEKYLLKHFIHFLNQNIFCYWVVWVFHIFWWYISCQLNNLQIFYPIL